MKIKEIVIPIFCHRVTLISGNLNTVVTYLSSLYSENIWSLNLDWDAADALCLIVQGEIYIWWEDEPTIMILGHEIIHATYRIMKDRGVLLEDQETFCYIWQYIMEQVWNTLPSTQTVALNHPLDVEDTQSSSLKIQEL